MKPVYLEMKYFGPHEDSIIDFRALEEAPIFLIGGDTGAGKSTIFDAMTYALFGSTTGDRDAKELRSQFAPDDEATEVVFYFEQGNQLYEMTRTPEQYLTKKRGSGLGKKVATVKLAIVKEVGGVEVQSVASKPVDVGNEIASILNLTADQFKKIILLPQNDFSEFLKSKTNDKEVILKKIFGTQMFTDFTTELKGKYDEARKQSEGFETRLQFELESNIWTDEEKEQLSAEANSQKVELLNKYVQTRSNSLSDLKKSKVSIDKSVEKADMDYQVAKDLQKKFADLEKYKLEFKTKITDKAEQHKSEQVHLSELQWANPLKDIVRDLATKTSDHQQSLKTQVEQSNAENLSEEAYQKAKVLSDTLSGQSDDIEKKKSQITQLTALIPRVESIEQLRQKLEVAKPKLAVLQKQLDEQSEAAKLISDKITLKNKQLVPTADLQKTRNSLTKEKETFVETLTPLLNLVTNLDSDIRQENVNLGQLKSEQVAKQSALDVAKKNYDKQISRRQGLMIAQLQKELVDGEPCVVCGSTDHSNMVHTVDANETELKAAMEQVDQSQNTFAAAEKSLSTVKGNVVKSEAELKSKTVSLDKAKSDLSVTYKQLTEKSDLNFSDKFSLEQVKHSFDTKISDVDRELTTANNLSNEIKTLETQFKSANDAVNQAKLDVTAKKTEITNTENDLKKQSAEIDMDKSSSELSEEKSRLTTETAEYQKKLESAQSALQQSKLDLSTVQTQLKDTEVQVKKQTSDIKSLQKQLNDSLSADDAKTHDAEVLNGWISEINEDKLSRLHVSISQYSQEYERLNSEIKKLTAELSDKQVPNIDELAKIQKDWNQKKEVIIQQVSFATKTLEDSRNSLKNVQKIMDDQGDFAKKLGEITSLYNIVTGKDGNDRKLKLETYVVQNYLQRVLNYANDHFINLLSNNRYSFELADEGSDKRTDHGLDINVFDNETGDSRSSNTLSGGETFIAALSIALSLSEVVQSSSNGVQIDALFVDEGFGSLDHETLEKAMTALETIGENRMVGVISHIESMKNSIGQQVYIKKLGDGRSTVEMINK
ncbi:AAA family ATPase [Companilactobacillus ginsenosidimutans]|uniref:Nuclease SbcCD subunit C n=1 Tax=Companilactobacillus ginsenosidimutans TaxID=1007676 RepID=A0A0H4QHF4_9LACO|nr:SMC family ATPase [Companilactobacillus ginsenosidimutans]AKP67387.1 exonuclease SbcC [Companilactobacillus ginsenosidimutans]